MRSWKWALWGAAGLAVAALGGTAYTFGGAPLRAGVDRDPKKLIPSFAKKLNILFARMRARGFDPLLWEGYRTPARAAELATKGTGIRLSMHSYGAAADILSESKLWNASPAFWKALGEEATALGLVWGGYWSDEDKDRPHVQAVALEDQDGFRAMGPSERSAFVASRLA